MKISRKWIELVWANTDEVLRAQDIPYNATLSIKEKIDELERRGLPTFFAQEDSGISTTSTSWRTALKLPVSHLESSYYRLGWSIEYRCQSTSRNIQIRIIDEDGTVYGNLKAEPKDANNYIDFSGFVYIEMNTINNYSFAIQYKSSSSWTTVRVRRRRLEFWKVHNLNEEITTLNKK